MKKIIEIFKTDMKKVRNRSSGPYYMFPQREYVSVGPNTSPSGFPPHSYSAEGRLRVIIFSQDLNITSPPHPEGKPLAYCSSVRCSRKMLKRRRRGLRRERMKTSRTSSTSAAARGY